MWLLLRLAPGKSRHFRWGHFPIWRGHFEVPERGPGNAHGVQPDYPGWHPSHAQPLVQRDRGPYPDNEWPSIHGVFLYGRPDHRSGVPINSVQNGHGWLYRESSLTVGVPPDIGRERSHSPDAKAELETGIP